MTGYYDYVLGLIPLAFFGLTGGLVQTSLTFSQAIPIAAAVAAAIVGHALFIRAPVSVTAQAPSEPVQTNNQLQMQNAD